MKVNNFEMASGFLSIFLVALGTWSVLRDREDAKYAKQIIPEALKRDRQLFDEYARGRYEIYRDDVPCPDCGHIQYSTGSYNTAIGINAMQSTTAGANNTAIGFNAEPEMTDGEDLMCLGNSSCSGTNIKRCTVDVRSKITLGEPLTRYQIEAAERELF